MEMEQKILFNELIQGKEFTEQLRVSSAEERQFLVDKILSSYEKALSLLNWGTVDSPLSSTTEISPRNDFADQEYVDTCPKNVYKKRKTEPRWTKQVKVCFGSGREGPIDDGYNWRKYGQKDILGAKFPRGYFRCTHRHSQGCLATKQVQRSDQDSSTFEVTYRGRHTCFQSSPSSAMSGKMSKSNEDAFGQFEHHEQKPKPNPIKLKQLSFNYKDGIKIQGLEPADDIFPSFSFPNVEEGNVEHNIFMTENNLLGGFSPAFVSPATSDFSTSPCQMYSFGLDCSVRTPESDSNPASVSNSPIGEWDVLIDFTDFEANFPLEEPELYS